MMYESLSARQEAKKLAREFVELVRKGPIDDQTRQRFLAWFPASRQSFLADAVVTLLSAGQESCQPEAKRRMQSEGIKLLRMAGLSFASDVLNDEIVPILVGLAREAYDRTEKKLEKSHDLMERLGVLAQLASRIAPSSVNRCIETLLYCARVEASSRYDPALATLLAAFGPELKRDPYAPRSNLREEARTLCAEAISKLLVEAVKNIAEVDPSRHGTVSRYFSIAHWACDGLLSLLPALSDDELDETAGYVESAIDSLDWFVRKPHGYPGDSIGIADQRRFEFLRSTSSIVLGIVALKFPGYQELVRDIRLPSIDAPDNRGSVFLRVIRASHPDKALPIARELVQEDLREMGKPTENGLTYEQCFDTSVLAWHLGAFPKVVLQNASEALPPHLFRSKAYLTRALDCDAWCM
jgi:hypothetical protein